MRKWIFFRAAVHQAQVEAGWNQADSGLETGHPVPAEVLEMEGTLVKRIQESFESGISPKKSVH